MFAYYQRHCVLSSLLTLGLGSTFAHAAPATATQHSVESIVTTKLPADAAHKRASQTSKREHHLKYKAAKHKKMKRSHLEQQAFNRACVGHEGKNVQIKVGDKRLTGQCKTVFRPHYPSSS